MVAMYLTSAEAAHRLGIAKRTLYRAVKRGEILPALRSPGGWLRFLDSDVEAYARRVGRARPYDPAVPIQPRRHAATAAPRHTAAEHRLTRRRRSTARFRRQQQAEEAEAMAAVSTALSSALDPGTVYQIILTQAARVLPFDHAAIALYKDGWVVNVATLGGPHIPPETPLVPVNPSTSTWQALTSGKPAYLADTAEVPDWTDPPPWRGPYRVRSMIVVPLLIDGVLIGSFKVNSYTPHYYTAKHIQRAAAFGERATQAVRNARLFAAERERARAAEELAQLRQEQAEESRALAQVGAALTSVLEPAALYEIILRQSTQVLPGDLTNLLLYQDGWVTVAASAGVTALAAGTRICPLDGSARFWMPNGTAPTYVPDTSQEPSWRDIPPNVGEHRIRSIIVVPLLVDGVVVGSFDVCSMMPHFYTERHVQLASVFAELVAQALRNARLYAAEQAARRQAELAEANLRAIIGASPAPMVAYDREGTVRSWNAAAEHIFGRQAEEVLGRPAPMVPEDERPAFEALHMKALQGAEVRDREARWLRQDGSWLDLQFSLAPLHGAHGDPIGTIAVFADITARKCMEEALVQQALHDALTGLPNRTLLTQRLQQALHGDRGYPTPFALLLLDLDNFKEVNDTLGHQAGDSLLHGIGVRLQAQMRPTDTVARLGGDEFAILLHDTPMEGAITVAERLLGALAIPCVVEEHSIEMRGSVGIALSPGHGRDPATLLRKADVAMYVAKHSRSGYAIYRAEQDQHSPDRLTLSADLRTAIEQGQLRVHYQPLVQREGGVDGVEALVRWQHPQRGLVPPGEFIPLAEKTGLIAPLTRWVLETALRQCQSWQRAGLRLRVAVNLSMRTLHDPQLAQTVSHLLQQYDVAPEQLSLEITETTLMANPEQAMAMMRRLHELGVRLAVDDFGTGYSSLAYLTRLPVHEVKIDKSFVQGMQTDSHDDVVVRSIIDLGRNLGLQVVAEGVETEQAWQMLRGLGCQLAQGYHLSRPLPIAELDSWLRTRPEHARP